jgi:TnpA family transposase
MLCARRASQLRAPGLSLREIDSLFEDNVIDWDLIEKHWTDLLRTAISIREGGSRA